jgi:hypothetical protein
MNKLLKFICGVSAAAVLFVTPTLIADDGGSDGKDGKSVRGKSLEERVRELEEKLKDVGYTGVKGSGIKLSGYVDTSYMVNIRGQNGSSPVPGAGTGASGSTSGTYSNGRVFDTQQDEFTLHAVKLTLEKDKDDSDFPAGFRADMIYGADANILNNRGIAAGAFAPGTLGTPGNEPYRDNVQDDSDFFLEQAYINLGVPLGDGIDVKIGKMVTLVGYEVIESPANANFSRSFAFGLAPFTQTGVTFGYNINEYITATMGLINGVDNSDNLLANGGGNSNTEFSGVYRVDVKSPDWSWGTFNLGVSGLFGNDSTVDATSASPGASGTNSADNGTDIVITDVAGTWARVGGHEPLSLGFEVLMRDMQRRTFLAAGNAREDDQDDTTYALYAKYQVNDWFYLAGRGEYWWADDRSAAAAGIYNRGNGGGVGIGTANGDHISIWSGTLTAGFNVWKDTLVRLEWRHDEVAGHEDGFINGQSVLTGGNPQIRQGQDTIAVNVAYSF